MRWAHRHAAGGNPVSEVPGKRRSQAHVPPPARRKSGRCRPPSAPCRGRPRGCRKKHHGDRQDRRRCKKADGGSREGRLRREPHGRGFHVDARVIVEVARSTPSSRAWFRSNHETKKQRRRWNYRPKPSCRASSARLRCGRAPTCWITSAAASAPRRAQSACRGRGQGRRKPAAKRSPAPVVSTRRSTGKAGTAPRLARGSRRGRPPPSASRRRAPSSSRSAASACRHRRRSGRGSAARGCWRTGCRGCRRASGRGTRRGSDRRRRCRTASARRCVAGLVGDRHRLAEGLAWPPADPTDSLRDRRTRGRPTVCGRRPPGVRFWQAPR